MTLYEAVDLTEGEPVQYVGVHAVRWQREWGMPKLGFREVEDTRDDKIAALVKACERFRATLEYGGESGGDTFLYTSPQDLREFKVAIKDVGK